MSVLVVGGNGLVGPYLVKKLQDQGEHVISFGTKYPAKPLPGILYEIGDVTEYGTINTIIKKYKVTKIIHNAAISSPKFFADNPHKVFRINVQGTLAVMEAARNFDIEKVVYVSSIAVYGKTDAQVLYEDLPRRGVDCYSASKVACEEIVRNYAGVPAVSVRLGYVYGPGRVVTCPIRDMVMEIVKTGKVEWEQGMDQVQDYIFAEDAAAGIIAAMRSDHCTRSEYNMASGEAVPFSRIVKKVQEYFPEAVIRIGSGDLGFHPSGRLDMEHTFRDFGWTPGFTIEKGLDRYIPWLEEEAKKLCL